MSGVYSAIKGVLSFQLFMLLTITITFIGTPIVLSLIDKESYGLWILISQAISYFALFDFGLSLGMYKILTVNRTASNQELSEILSTSFFSMLLIGIVLSLIGTAAIPLIQHSLKIKKESLDVTYFLFISLLILNPLLLPFRQICSVFHAHQKQFLSNTLQFIAFTLNMPLNILFLYLGFDLWAFVYSSCIVAVIIVCVNTYFFYTNYPSVSIKPSFYNRRWLPQMYRYGIFLFINYIAWLLVSSTDRLLIGSLISLTAVTVFSLSVRLPEVLLSLTFTITDNFFPLMSEVGSTNDSEKFKTIHHKLMLFSVTFSTIIAWMIFLFDESFVYFWVGNNNFIGSDIIAIISILFIIHTIRHVSTACLNSAGLVKGYSLVFLFEGILNLGLSIWLGKLYGVTGIMLGTICACLITSGWYTPFLAKRYMKIGLREYLLIPIIRPVFILSFIGIGIYYLLKYYQIELIHSLVEWIGFLSLTLIVFICASWFLILKNNFKEDIERIKTRLYK